MIDSIGLGEFLLRFGVIVSAVFFIAGFILLKMFFKKNILWSSIFGICLGILGFFASPYIFLIFLKLQGYSL